MRLNRHDALKKLIELSMARTRTSSKAAILADLVNEGLYAADGQLTERYGGTGSAKDARSDVLIRRQ